MNSRPNAPTEQSDRSSSSVPTRHLPTCVIVLGIALVFVLLVVGALALLIGPDLMASIHQIRGTTYYEQGNLDLAIAEFDQAIELRPELASAYVDRGLAFQGKGDPARALEDYIRRSRSNRS